MHGLSAPVQQMAVSASCCVFKGLSFLYIHEQTSSVAPAAHAVAALAFSFV